MRGLYGFFIGILIGAISFFVSNSVVLTLHNTSQFWMCWYGFWNFILGIFILLSTFGVTVGGAVTCTPAGGVLGGLMGSVVGAGASLLILWIPFLARCVFLIGGPYLMWTASTVNEIDVPRAMIGALLLLIGLLVTRRSSSSSG
ncbi:hypothetical protein HYV70_05745 [Candidatus Uhrbacteria bacterium]|nr:hypothetical protein [Candidatus Uhrbacteria bacterium]